MEDQCESASGLGGCRATTIWLILDAPAISALAILVGGFLVAAGRIDAISRKRDRVVKRYGPVQLVLFET